MRNALLMVYPSQCVACDELVDRDGSLCGSCWRDTPFITGLTCHACGRPLLSDGSDEQEGEQLCDSCMAIRPIWSQGRAALEYSGKARSMTLALKNGNEDIARAAGRWMAHAGRDLFFDDTLLVPIPLHWTRLLQRRYNQSALLAQVIAEETGADLDETALWRTRRTRKLDKLSAEQRAMTLWDAIKVNTSHNPLKDRAVLLIDDVHTTGATLSAATRAALQAGARRVDVLALARTLKDA